MVKKLQKMAAKKEAASNGAWPAGLMDSQLAQTVKDSAQQIWAAGLGAFAKAQGEGGKVFETLVKEGLKLQKKTQTSTEEKIGAVASKMSGLAGEVGAKAGQHWDKLETIFEDRVARALNRLGVPSSQDIDALIARIDALSAAVGVPATKATNAKASPKSAAPVKARAKGAAEKTVVKAAVRKPASKAVSKAVAKAATKAEPETVAKTTPSPKAVSTATKVGRKTAVGKRTVFKPATQASQPAKAVAEVVRAQAPARKAAVKKKVAATSDAAATAPVGNAVPA